ncbi:hypothetical protein RC74_13545 [Falsihalocynthiibacter arcticus]|uniref:Uncharacterized protein n=1 Tax=Falsihalocynthiibacter arcticus TaxID=1579316 RepID=A0A126V383_9RHOB|nr:hypothetical protein RC74_13545 [Falsihalocynthiibacter arcticus]
MVAARSVGNKTGGASVGALALRTGCARVCCVKLRTHRMDVPTTAHLVLLVIATLTVGCNEEALTRGVSIVAARGSS